MLAMFAGFFIWLTQGLLSCPDSIPLLRLDLRFPALYAVVPQMAALVNLSESRFKQKFKQATGIPPAEFTVREKIRESQTLLKDPARTVTSIAMELGFSSSQHFSVLFRKYTGLSPIQYRQNHEFVS